MTDQIHQQLKLVQLESISLAVIIAFKSSVWIYTFLVFEIVQSILFDEIKPFLMLIIIIRMLPKMMKQKSLANAYFFLFLLDTYESCDTVNEKSLVMHYFASYNLMARNLERFSPLLVPWTDEKKTKKKKPQASSQHIEQQKVVNCLAI